MKTLSFHEFEAGRAVRKPLVSLDTPRDGVALRSGLNLLVAPNGYGKSTLLQAVSGVLRPLKGYLTLDGKTVDPRSDVMYVPEYLAFPKMVYPDEWVEFAGGRALSDDERVRWAEAFRMTGNLKSFLGRLSQGERRKVTWLAAHASRRPVVLMDEPMDGLDILSADAARDMLETWGREGRVTIVVAHQVAELAERADAVWLIHDGRLKSLDSVSDPGAGGIVERIRTAVRKLYLPARGGV